MKELPSQVQTCVKPVRTSAQIAGLPLENEVASAERNLGPREGDRVVAEAAAGFSTAERLAHRGFSVKQLLEFCIEHVKLKQLSDTTLTKDVVRDIVIPETAQDRTCYMESDFMEARGGPKRAQKLVSHAWDSQFKTTMLNIVLDATGWGSQDIKKMAPSLTVEVSSLSWPCCGYVPCLGHPHSICFRRRPFHGHDGSVE